MITLILWLIAFVVVAYIVFMIVGRMPIPQPWNNIITLLVCLALLYLLLEHLGLLSR